MNKLSEFRLGLPAKKVDFELKTALEIKDKAHQCSLDWFGEIFNRKLYKELGFSSVNQYAKDELGFSKSKIGHYISLTRKLEKLPKLKNSITNGELGYTVARVLADVADVNNEQDWVDFAKNNSRLKVEEEVKRAKQEARDEKIGQPSFFPKPMKKSPQAVLPVRVDFEMSPVQFARYEKLMEQIRKNRIVSSDKVEALLEVLHGFLEGVSEESLVDEPEKHPRGYLTKPSTQIHLHHCPTCESTMVQTSKGEMEIGENEFERSQCDCLTSAPNEPNKSAIAPSIRRKIFAKARHQCETPGCNHTRFLEIHHIVPRSKGGGNDPANLKVLCAGCHSRAHSHVLGGQMIKEASVIYGWNEN